MTPEDQRIAIAEACGWKQERSPFSDKMLWITPTGFNAGSQLIVLPDYLNDLNAMHEAEKILGLNRCDEFGEILTKIVTLEISNKNRTGEDFPVSNLFNWHATASQRAEAFLRTTGKWKE